MSAPSEIDILLEIVNTCDQISTHFEQNCPLIVSELQAKLRTKRSAVYSDETLFILNKIYDKRTHLTTHERKRVARELGLTPKQVTVWFQNRRSRDEKHPLLSSTIKKRERNSHAKQVVHSKTQINQDVLSYTRLKSILLNNEFIANIIELKLHALAESTAILDQNLTVSQTQNSIREYIPPSPVLSLTESMASSSQ